MNIEEIKETLRYDPETGFIYHIKTGKRACRAKNNGYVVVAVPKGKRELAHRVAWFLFYGFTPPDCIDHINQNKHDNRICNLRLATCAENLRNRSRQKNNVSGYKGVSFHAASNKYRAQIKVDGRKIHLGLYGSAIKAHDAYVGAANRYHAEFACVS